MNKKKSKSKSLGVVLFFLVTFIMGTVVGISIGYALFAHKVVDNGTNQNIKVIEDEKIKKELFDIINNNSLEKVIYNYRTNEIAFKNITNDEKLFLAGIDSYYKVNGEWTTFDNLKKQLVTKYGSDFNVKSESYNFHDIATINYSGGSYSYNGKDFKYVDNQMFIDIYNINKLELRDGKYYLNVNGIYHQVLNSHDTYSNDKGFIYNEAVSNKTTIDDLYKTNHEQFMQYDLVFEKSNNKYILVEFIKN